MLRAILSTLLLVLLARDGLAEPARLDDRLKHELAGLQPLRGAALTADALEGRVVVVTLFASWCPPCNAEFLHLNEIHREFAADGLTVVAVNLFEDFGGLSSPARLARFLDGYAPPFHVVAGDDVARAAFGGISRIPTLFVFDRGGRRAFAFVHERGAAKTNVTAEELRAVIVPLL